MALLPLSVKNCLHPVYAATMLSKSYEGSMADGLIPPMVLAGPGADDYCASLGVGIVSNEQMKTESALKDFVNAKKLIDSSNNSETTLCDRLDTVGGVAIDVNGESMACVSSGGILLKKEGRIGHSAQFGAAIWAEQNDQNNTSVAVSLSGCGEALVRVHLAESLAQQILSM